MDRKIDLEELCQKLPELDIHFESRTKKEHREIHRHDEPGHKFAYLFKKQNGYVKPNGYSLFVADQVKLLGRSVTLDDYSNAQFSDSWTNLSDEEKLVYKSHMCNINAPKGFDRITGRTLKQQTEINQLEHYRQKYGSDRMSDMWMVRLYHPPTPAGHRPLRGRENVKDLTIVRALYTCFEKEDRDQDVEMMERLENLYRLPDVVSKRIYVLSCVPVSHGVHAVNSVFQPLEMYLTSFTLTEGLSELGYLSYVSAGQDLTDLLLMVDKKNDGTPAYKLRKAAEAAGKTAWNQAHMRHNLPYNGFQPLDAEYRRDILDLDRCYDGWDLYYAVASDTVKPSTDYEEMHSTILEILRADADETGNLPPVFTKLNDCEMVSDCLNWLRNMAEHNESHSLISVYSLEHLAWHLSGILGRPLDEGTIEEGLNTAKFKYNYKLKCAYHERRPDKIVCARGTVLNAIYNLCGLMLPVCGIQRTGNHVPYGYDYEDIHDDEVSIFSLSG